MPSKYDGPLDSGRLETVNLVDEKYWMPIRPQASRRWSFDIPRPAFLTRLAGRNKSMRPTAWLDGLKGFAALIVYWHHHVLWAHDGSNQSPIFENAYGYKGEYHFATFPIVRNFFAGGHFAVSIFFIVSGYVLSVKSLSLIQAQDVGKLSDAVGSALFRRWLRLYIPVWGTTFVYMTSWHLFGYWTAPTPPKGSYRDELWNWYSEIKNYSFMFNPEFLFQYNFHAWSIPVEFRGSLVVYTALLALSRCTRNARLWCTTGLIFYFLYVADGWYAALFTAGMLLCDLDLLAAANKLPKALAMFDGFKELIFFHLFVVSMYLGGVPSHEWDLTVLRNSPGWVWLSYLKPQAVFDYKWFYLFWAAFFMVSSVPRLPWLKYFFETRFCQYLGRICFALYLVHGPVIWALGDRLYAAVGYYRERNMVELSSWINAFPMSKAGPMGLEPAFLAPQIILLPVTFWLAEVVTRLFDEPSVKIANWVYKKTLPPAPSLPLKA